MSARPTLVVIGAHPMDAEILAGAAAARLMRRREANVWLVHLTDGGGNYPFRSRDRSSRQSKDEASGAASVLGVRSVWMGLSSKELSSERGQAEALAERLVELQPVSIVTHWRGSWHPRHRTAHRLVVAATRRLPSPPELAFGENFEDLHGWSPNAYVEVTGFVDRWWESLRCYQLFRASAGRGERTALMPYSAYYRVSTRIRGLEAGVEMAQAFKQRSSMPSTLPIIGRAYLA